MTNHVVVTRCNFSNDEVFEKYFDVMKKVFIPSLNNQSDKNFDLLLIVNPNHYNQIRGLIDSNINIIPFFDKKHVMLDIELVSKTNISFFSSLKQDIRNFVISNDYTIQTRHDCDDFMNKNYIEKIHQLYEEYKDVHDTFILNFQPTKFDLNSKKEFTHSRDYNKVCSMFSTLCQKEIKNGIFDEMHDKLNRVTRNIIYIPETFVKLTIHGNNILSKINNNDKIINEYVQI